MSSSEQVWTGIRSWPPDVLVLTTKGGPCMVRSKVSGVMVTWDPLWTDRHDRHDWKLYFPITLLAGGKYYQSLLVISRTFSSLYISSTEKSTPKISSSDKFTLMVRMGSLRALHWGIYFCRGPPPFHPSKSAFSTARSLPSCMVAASVYWSCNLYVSPSSWKNRHSMAWIALKSPKNK